MIDNLTNAPIFSVSELSGALKKTLEAGFGHIRVRGELSGVKKHSSGHIYCDLKDGNAVLNSVCWRGTRLNIVPENGMDVICTGRITTYPMRSNYQLVIETVELAGEGALLKLLEDRKKKLAAEGLFDDSRKRKLPYLPDVIGVVTSPTGAVIKDILHRIEERCPRHVIVWPVAVQGPGAAQQIADAVAGFNAMQDAARPDIIIVARGGGSIEDLMPFNEENVVRAVSDSTIPVISAVGHETDTTLIDFVSDRRAPTPTAAAEMAVPVRLDILNGLNSRQQRLNVAVARQLERGNAVIRHAALAMTGVPRQLEFSAQRVDDNAARLQKAPLQSLHVHGQQWRHAAERLRFPVNFPAELGKIITADTRLLQGLQKNIDSSAQRFERQALRFKFSYDLPAAQLKLHNLKRQLNQLLQRNIDQKTQYLQKESALLESFSYRNVLKRGFALLTDQDGHTLTSIKDLSLKQPIQILLKDGNIKAQITALDAQ